MRLPNVRGAIMGASHPRQLELFEAVSDARLSELPARLDDPKRTL